MGRARWQGRCYQNRGQVASVEDKVPLAREWVPRLVLGPAVASSKEMQAGLEAMGPPAERQPPSPGKLTATHLSSRWLAVQGARVILNQGPVVGLVVGPCWSLRQARLA